MTHQLITVADCSASCFDPNKLISVIPLTIRELCVLHLQFLVNEVKRVPEHILRWLDWSGFSRLDVTRICVGLSADWL